MNENEPLISNPDLGQDEESVQILIKKHHDVENDLASYEFNITSLKNTCKVFSIFF